MPDFCEFFEQALADNGVDARVMQSEDPMNDKFYIAKPIGDEQLTYSVAINTRIDVTPDEVRKEIIQQARVIADAFEEKLTDTFQWGNGRSVTVSAHEGGWAECGRCGNKIDFPLMPKMTFSESAELSTPQPHPSERESLLNNLDDASRMILKMYLIGRLRERCGYDCANQKHNNVDNDYPYMKGRFYDEPSIRPKDLNRGSS